MPQNATTKSRKPPATLRAIARLRVQGRSKSAIARELGIDRQTVTRNLSDPVTQAEMGKLKQQQERAAVTPAPQRSTPHVGAPTPAGPQYKVPLEVVPLEMRRITHLQLKTGEVSREVLNPVLLEAVEEWIRLGCPAPETRPAPPQPERPPNRGLEEFVKLMDGPATSYGRMSVGVPLGAFDRRFR